jgi:hypothetical protein
MLTIRVQPYTSNGYHQRQISLHCSEGDNTQGYAGEVWRDVEGVYDVALQFIIRFIPEVKDRKMAIRLVVPKRLFS